MIVITTWEKVITSQHSITWTESTTESEYKIIQKKLLTKKKKVALFNVICTVIENLFFL